MTEGAGDGGEEGGRGGRGGGLKREEDLEQIEGDEEVQQGRGFKEPGMEGGGGGGGGGSEEKGEEEAGGAAGAQRAEGRGVRLEEGEVKQGEEQGPEEERGDGWE